MTDVRFLHTADWQLGMTREFLSDEAQARFAAARTEVITRIGEVARARGAQFVVVCGDVFESNAVSPTVVGRAAEAMAGIGCPVLLLPGNHDPLDATSVLASRRFRAVLPDNVVVLATDRHAVADGVEIVAAPWFSKRPEGDPVCGVLGDLPADGTVRIVVGHGALDIFGQGRPDRQIRTATLESLIEQGRVHYVALGDRHSTTAIGRAGRIHYSGAPEVTAFDEVDPGNVLAVTLSDGGARCEVDPVQVGRWTFLELTRQLTGAADVDALAADLAALPAKDRTMVRLGLSGALRIGEHARLDQLLADREPLFAGLQRRSDRTVAVAVDAADQDELGLSGWAATAAAELARVSAGDGPDAAVAGSALTLLHRWVATG
jgi:DNA repair exonuclease SbcCD nuclease subunit